jgi:D-serine deaminase-like pyridoxal phosphate-dependent protein
MSEDAEREAEAVALAHQMGYADGAAAARATVERLEARIAELEAALEAAQAYADAYVATASGPERDLRDLEMMAKKFDYHPVRQGVYVYWDDGQFVYRRSPMGNHIPRAEALALMKGAKDAG